MKLKWFHMGADMAVSAISGVAGGESFLMSEAGTPLTAGRL
jgi:hypothetical protein